MSDGFLVFIVGVCAICVSGLFWVGGKADVASKGVVFKDYRLKEKNT